jgi:hypothetical protein
MLILHTGSAPKHRRAGIIRRRNPAACAALEP